MDEIDVAIIGGGPAGVSAAIYSKRRGTTTMLFEKGLIGGEVATTDKIDNYPGMKHISGMELAKKFEEHLKELEIEPVPEEVTELKTCGNDCFTIKTSSGKEYRAKSVIIATGTEWKKLKIPGEKEFSGKGVSYCATCDGPLFKGKDVLVVGGGNTALSSALFLTEHANKVYLLHRRGEFRGEEAIVNQLKEKNTEFILNSVAKEIKGSNFVEKVVYENVDSGEQKELEVHGIFVNIGLTPASELAKMAGCELDDGKYIKADPKTMQTSVPGIFAAGDIAGGMKQIVTAVSRGAIAATYAYVHARKVSASLVV